MYTLLSNRIKNKSGEPEVYVYNEFSPVFRNQVFYILEDVLDPYTEYDNNCWELFGKWYCREKGLKKLGYHGCGKSDIEEYFESCNNNDFLDVLDFLFHLIDKYLRKIKPKYKPTYDSNKVIDQAITELNYRFKSHNLGYEFVNSQIIIIEDTLLHDETVKPALRLLFEEDFEGAEDEIRNAFKNRSKNDNKNAILEAEKAFESTLKTICDKIGYNYNKNKSTAKGLIEVLEKNNFYPKYMQAHLTALRTTLETGLPVVRNKLAGHGQGEEIKVISDEFADYALHLAATNISFLVGLYKSKKKKSY